MSARLRLDGHAGLGQCSAHTALGKAQNIFRQAVRCIHIGLATVYQHAAQAALQHQLHLFRYHCRVIYFKPRQQLVGEVMRRTFLLIRQLVDRMTWIRKVCAGGDEQTARV